MELRWRAVAAVLALAASSVAVRALLRRLALEVDGDSMRPTLAAGDVVVTVPLRRAPVRGELVVAADPRRPERRMVKRVVGLAGDRPDLDDVPPDHVFLVGDDRRCSTDSRTFGAVAGDAVHARVLARVRRGQAGRRATTSSSGSSSRTPSPS